MSIARVSARCGRAPLRSRLCGERRWTTVREAEGEEIAEGAALAIGHDNEVRKRRDTGAEAFAEASERGEVIEDGEACEAMGVEGAEEDHFGAREAGAMATAEPDPVARGEMEPAAGLAGGEFGIVPRGPGGIEMDGEAGGEELHREIGVVAIEEEGFVVAGDALPCVATNEIGASHDGEAIGDRGERGIGERFGERPFGLTIGGVARMERDCREIGTLGEKVDRFVEDALLGPGIVIEDEEEVFGGAACGAVESGDASVVIEGEEVDGGIFGAEAGGRAVEGSVVDDDDVRIACRGVFEEAIEGALEVRPAVEAENDDGEGERARGIGFGRR